MNCWVIYPVIGHVTLVQCRVLYVFFKATIQNLWPLCVFARRNTSKRGESFGISRIGSKIKGVFKSSTMEGAMLPQYAMIEGEDDTVRQNI